MKLNPLLLDAYLKCRTKCFLRSHAEIETGNLYADWLRSQNDSYKKNGIQRLTGMTNQVDCGTSKTANGKIKVPENGLVTYFPAVGKCTETIIHMVERIPPKRKSTPAQLIPIRFVFTNNIKRHGRLLLAFDAFVLAEMTGDNINIGKIIHGDDYVSMRVNTPAFAEELGNVVGKAVALVSNSAPPELILNRHCSACEFQSRCRK